MKFYIRDNKGIINELVMISGGDSEFMLLTLYGEIDLKTVSKIGSKMDVKGLENLEKMKDSKRN